MAISKRFERPGIKVEAQRDMNGLSYVAWRPNVSQWCGDRSTLLRFIAWPAKTPTGDELRAWLDEVSGTAKAEPVQAEPQEQTKTII